ncbi:MAG: hypothetical protein JXA38_05520 [Methanosarcinaceae archaeon]|nr:hypothetical protein [Methanosarcinaceae archaeon]
MSKNHCLAKHIEYAAWIKLMTIISYNAEWSGKGVEFVNPFKHHRCVLAVVK